MRSSNFVLLVLAFAGGGHAAEMELSGCEFPDAPIVPDGATASEAELGEVGAKVHEFVANGQSALECLLEVETSMGADITKDQRATIIATHDAGVDRLKAVAQRYNEEVRAYRER
jgi:hypothetical protein